MHFLPHLPIPFLLCFVVVVVGAVAVVVVYAVRGFANFIECRVYVRASYVAIIW